MAKHSVDFSHITAGALALVLAPAFWPSDAAAHTCDAPFSTDLIAGQTIDAGDVKVCNDATTLTVTYEATFPWCLLKTDLHVATSKSGIPQNKNGHPTPGKFAYGEEYGGCLDGKASFEIPLDDIGAGVEPEDTVFIAAHAEVEHEDGREEGAWGKGTRFVERGPWAMYFTYEVQAPPPATACVCDSLTSPSGLTGAEVLGRLCPDGALGPGSGFVDDPGFGFGVQGDLFNYLVLFGRLCVLSEPNNEVSEMPLGSPGEAAACRAHLVNSCGL